MGERNKLKRGRKQAETSIAVYVQCVCFFHRCVNLFKIRDDSFHIAEFLFPGISHLSSISSLLQVRC